jgi:hypothetical protein
MSNGGIIGPVQNPQRGSLTTTFTASGTYTSPGFGPGQADYLVVAGGGGGSPSTGTPGTIGGGGGADEIRKKIKIGMESDNNTNKIIELIESLKESIIDQDLDRIKYYVAEISIKRMLDKMEK